MGDCNPGLKHTSELLVCSEHTAEHVGSGDVPVLGTPTLLALAEGACLEAICEDLPEGQTSVGAWSEIEHLRPSPVGHEVTAEATLRGHHGRRLEFVVVVRDGDEIVARVRHRRVLVDRAQFLEKLGATAV